MTDTLWLPIHVQNSLSRCAWFSGYLRRKFFDFRDVLVHPVAWLTDWTYNIGFPVGVLH